MAESVESAPRKSGAGVSLLIPLLNTVAILAVLGMLIYTQVLYQRPVITESSERERLSQLRAAPVPVPTPGTMIFEPVTVNIKSTPEQPKAADGTSAQIQGKLHYAKMGFALELKDAAKKEKLETMRPVIMDGVLSTLGRKSFHELTTVQGRYVLKTQILDLTNQIAMKEISPKDPLVTNVYFTDFIVQ
jgi:flagellar basal body-associated protein FliL